jgi:hypothetical protein
MYEPIINSVLVQIDDKEGEWGGGNDESMLGRSYSKGTLIRIGDFVRTADYPFLSPDSIGALKSDIAKLQGRQILWNEGTEAGTTFEFDGKLFGMIYWWDIRGVLVGEKVK